MNKIGNTGAPGEPLARLSWLHIQDSTDKNMDKTTEAGQPPIIAHVAVGADGNQRRHSLGEHLSEVSKLASEFSSVMGAEEWARIAGLWHDIGKYRPGFQTYISQALDAHIEGKVKDREKTHSAAGALHAMACLEKALGPMGKLVGKVLAYLVAGHHAGLADWYGGLDARLSGQDTKLEHDEALAAAPEELREYSGCRLDLKSVPGGLAEHGAFALWVRLLFSCLVDADFLDTERFMDEAKAEARGEFATLDEMRAAYNRHMAKFAADTEVKRIRADILRQCRDKAEFSPGLFSLTVPTGGGKTLASLGFALDHALAHGKRRIIYAIPYTSIIEQTADVFRDVFASLGKEALVEHHSQAESAPEQETTASRLACENWDAPLVVTTNVQLFESLFAARTSRCRKLHNLVGSIIILDEAQQLPAEFLQTILDVLRLLVKHYGVTVVLCTATQPALASTRYFDRQMRGLDGVTEIINQPDDLYLRLKRVEVRLPADLRSPTTWPAVAEELTARECVLSIVNSRKAAKELHALLPKGALHLSALMCGAHRTDVLARIKRHLEARRKGESQEALRVVSTQLVEAGVDLDFPVVYRALAGLDSIA
jgi:CRISPR-associated endonuclease/helicase Cas3